MKYCKHCGQQLPQVLRDRYGTEIKVTDVLFWFPSLGDVPAVCDGDVVVHGKPALVLLDTLKTDPVKGTYQVHGRTQQGKEIERSGYLDCPANEFINLHVSWGEVLKGLETL